MATACLAGGLVVAACQGASPASMTDATRAALADSVKLRAAAFFAQLSHPVADSILATYDSTGLVWGRSGTLEGFDSVASGVRRTWQGGASATLGTSDVKVRVLGPDEAVYSGIVSGFFHSAAGEDRPVRAAVTLVMQREGGTWRIVAGHESIPRWDPPTEAETASADSGAALSDSGAAPADSGASK